MPPAADLMRSMPSCLCVCELQYSEDDLRLQSNELRCELYNQVILAARLLEVVPMSNIYRAEFILKLLVATSRLLWNTPLSTKMYWLLHRIFQHYPSLIQYMDSTSVGNVVMLNHLYEVLGRLSRRYDHIKVSISYFKILVDRFRRQSQLGYHVASLEDLILTCATYRDNIDDALAHALEYKALYYLRIPSYKTILNGEDIRLQRSEQSHPDGILTRMMMRRDYYGRGYDIDKKVKSLLQSSTTMHRCDHCEKTYPLTSDEIKTLGDIYIMKEAPIRAALRQRERIMTKEWKHCKECRNAWICSSCSLEEHQSTNCIALRGGYVNASSLPYDGGFPNLLELLPSIWLAPRLPFEQYTSANRSDNNDLD
jgi:hypothetical protein